jgi:hypothetical protein
VDVDVDAREVALGGLRLGDRVEDGVADLLGPPALGPGRPLEREPDFRLFYD